MMHPPTLNDSISSTDSKVVDSMSGNIDTISMQLFENRVSDYITNNHESTPRVKLYRNNNTDNTCTELSYEVLIRNDAHGCGENKEYYSANGGTFLCSGLTNDYDANYVERHCNELSIANTGSDITCTTRMNMPNHSGSRTNNKQSLQMMDHSKGHLNRAMAFERMDCSYCSRNSRQLFDWMASETTTNRRGVTSTGKCQYYLVRICMLSSGYPFGGRSFNGNKWNLQLHELID